MKAGKNGSRSRRGAPGISEAEWVVMRVVWDKAPVTANEVVEALEGRVDWKPKTIQTLLTRLAKKGAVNFEKAGREYRFTPKVDARDYLHAASRSFLGRFFGGQVAPFLASFLEREQLSKTEIEELRRLIEERKS